MIWFWTIFVAAVLLWYILVTSLVAIKGAGDIREILNQMNDSNSDGE